MLKTWAKLWNVSPARLSALYLLPFSEMKAITLRGENCETTMDLDAKRVAVNDSDSCAAINEDPISSAAMNALRNARSFSKRVALEWLEGSTRRPKAFFSNELFL